MLLVNSTSSLCQVVSADAEPAHSRGALMTSPSEQRLSSLIQVGGTKRRYHGYTGVILDGAHSPRPRPSACSCLHGNGKGAWLVSISLSDRSMDVLWSIVPERLFSKRRSKVPPTVPARTSKQRLISASRLLPSFILLFLATLHHRACHASLKPSALSFSTRGAFVARTRIP